MSQTIDFNQLKEEALQNLKDGKPLFGEKGAARPMLKALLEASLQGEMDSHLNQADNNRRNGVNTKTLRTDMGEIEIDTPRDRNGDFEPQIVKKRQTILNNGIDERILSLYSGGLSYSDIQSHMKEMYDFEVSDATISKITDRLIPIIAEWRSRPLDDVYSVVFLDAMFFKQRKENRVEKVAVYNIMGINMEGKKEILGFYTAKTEGANFWLGVVNDLRNRGIQDILIACIDGLKGFPEAIHSIFPKTEIQLCIVHQIRNSIKYISYKDVKEFCADLKTIYTAPSKDIAEHNLLLLDEKWGEKYRTVIDSWQNNWDELSAYFKYSKEIRKLIYTTNPIESFHRQVRKYTKSKGAFSSENSLFKLVYCAIKKIEEKWVQPVRDWQITISQLAIVFGDRAKTDLA